MYKLPFVHYQAILQLTKTPYTALLYTVLQFFNSRITFSCLFYNLNSLLLLLLLPSASAKRLELPIADLTQHILLQ